VHTQVNTPVSIGNAIRLDNVQLQVEKANTLLGTVNGALAGSPVRVDLNFTKGKGIYLEAVSEKPISLDAVLKILFPGDISKAVVIPSFIVLPAMTVTYRSSTGKFSVRSNTEESTGGGKGVHAHPATAVSPLASQLPQPLLEPQERRRAAPSSCARITGAPNLSG
jgi:hypothetical protein